MTAEDSRKYRDPDWLYEEYYNKGRTLTDIAEELEVDHTTISKWRRKLDIPKPSRSEELRCPICDSVFIREKSRIERAKHVSVCSRSCLHEARRRGLLDWQGKVIHGDARELSALPDESIDLVVCSPPYYQSDNREQDEKNETNIDIAEWNQFISDVLEELYRVTKPDAKVCMVLSTAKVSDGSRSRQYDLPAHAYTSAIEVGFDLFDQIVWKKAAYANTESKKPLFGSYPYPTNLMVVQNHEVIQVFRKWESENYFNERDRPPHASQRKQSSRLEKEDWREYTDSIWEIEPVRFSEKYTPFPDEIAKRLIRMYSFVGDTVLDPFLGGGTTAIQALEEDREFVGYEINQDRCESARDRIEDHR